MRVSGNRRRKKKSECRNCVIMDFIRAPSTFEIFGSVCALLPVLYLFYTRRASSPDPPVTPVKEDKPIMQAPRTDLNPPKHDPFTLAQLKEFDGSDPSKPIYVSIKGAHYSIVCAYLQKLTEDLQVPSLMSHINAMYTAPAKDTTSLLEKMGQKGSACRVWSLKMRSRTIVAWMRRIGTRLKTGMLSSRQCRSLFFWLCLRTHEIIGSAITLLERSRICHQSCRIFSSRITSWLIWKMLFCNDNWHVACFLVLSSLFSGVSRDILFCVWSRPPVTGHCVLSRR